jgi:hypothetical protein
VGAYSPRAADVPRLVAMGIDHMGPTYALDDASLLSVAEASNVAAIYSIGVRHAAELAGLDPDEAAARVTSQLQIDSLERAAALYLLPEELPPLDPRTSAYATAVVDAVRRVDDDLRVFVYVPNHHTRREVQPLVDAGLVPLRGAYVDATGHTGERGWLGWAVRESVAAADTSPVFVALEIFRDPPPELLAEGALERAVLHDVALALVAGARGLVLYSAWPREGFTLRDRYLEAYGAAFSTLRESGLTCAVTRGTRLRSVVVHSQRARTTPVHVGPQRWVDVPVLDVAAWDLEGVRHVLVVNSTATTIDYEVSIDGDALRRGTMGPWSIATWTTAHDGNDDD